MAKGKSTAAIEKLLDEKGEIERWLAQLDAKGNKAPTQVLIKVKKDYQSRLEKVVEELQGFRDEITTALEHQQEEQGRLKGEDAKVSERLAEAELRHAVGEYDERAWGKLSGEITGELDRLRADLGTVETEISKLEDILALIDKGPERMASPTRAAVTPAPAPVMDTEIAELDDEIADLPDRSPKQTDAFDELAFLKSVTEDDEHGPSARRASGAHRVADGDGKPSGASVGAAGVEALPERDGAPVKGKMKKSLKCGDCGAQNLPTEWYCERCGAELAAL